MLPTINDIREAAKRIGPHVHRTPVLTCAALDRLAAASLFFKCENFQKVGAFKARGATNTVLSLTDAEAARGVATHSSGNHAAALAFAARIRGIRAHIVMPDGAPAIKKNAVAGYGATITFCGPTLEAREETLATVVAETGAYVVHPYNDERVIAGQGTAALELIEQIDSLDVVLTPVGGGGLTAGTAIVVNALSPGTRVIATEPELADDAYRSFRSGRIEPACPPETICDGLRAGLGEKTFALLKALVDDVVTVGEQEILDAMRLVWERMKIVIEPSAAVPLAAVLAGRVDITGARVGIVLSGGNVEPESIHFKA